MQEEEFKRKLSSEAYRVLREKGTEAPFSGRYWNEHSKGMYHCAACGAELFSSDAKFDSGTGWPSFTEPANLKNIESWEDASQGMVRTEVRCKNCGSHLGHMFDDGPVDRSLPAGPLRRSLSEASRQGKRYCINSVCLELKLEKEKSNKNKVGS